MDEEITVQEGQDLGTSETSGVQDDWFDAGWSDDGLTPEEDGSETVTESEAGTEDADQQPTGGEGDEAVGGSEVEDAEPEGSEQGSKDKGSDQSEGFTLRHLGQERTVDRDEVIRLAQQGMDYQRIREKWDGVKDDVPKLRMYEDFLKELAEARGGDIDSLIDETRARTMMAKAKAEGKTIEPMRAMSEAAKIRQNFNVNHGKSEDELTQERNAQLVQAFTEEFGPEIPFGEIPNEVWDEAMKSGDPVKPYQRHMLKELREEVNELKKQLEQTKQQQKNKERSTGSSKSAGAAAAKDIYSEGWNEGWNS